MAPFAPKASSNLAKSTHPDLTPDGELRPDVDYPVPHREFNRMRADPVRWQAFMDGVAQRQAREHADVQQQVGGRVYDGDPYLAYQAYQQDLNMARIYAARENELTSRDVEAMSLDEFDAVFDEHGRPREGYTYRPTDRDVNVDVESSIDPHSAREMNSNR